MGSNLLAMASSLRAMASNLIAMAFNLLAMGSNLEAMASNLSGETIQREGAWKPGVSGLWVLTWIGGLEGLFGASGPFTCGIEEP